MFPPSARDKLLKKYYLGGKGRQETMSLLGITNNNSMSSYSSRLKLHWSWPLANRKSGVAPRKIPATIRGGLTRGQQRRQSAPTLVKLTPHNGEGSQGRPPLTALTTRPLYRGTALIDDIELDEEEQRLCDLICGRYKPQGEDRPFLQLPRTERLRIRKKIQQYRE